MQVFHIILPGEFSSVVPQNLSDMVVDACVTLTPHVTGMRKKLVNKFRLHSVQDLYV